MSKVYILPGDPTPLARPRFGNKTVWDAQKGQKLVNGIGLREQHENVPLFEGALHLDITFYFPVPKVNRKHHKVGAFHIFKPDLSNLIKYVEDVAVDILYKDDAIIAKITAQKLYAEHPRTEFTITNL